MTNRIDIDAPKTIPSEGICPVQYFHTFVEATESRIRVKKSQAMPSVFSGIGQQVQLSNRSHPAQV